MGATPASAPQPLYAVHNRAVVAPSTREIRHACHHLTLVLRARGSYRVGPVGLPAQRPLIYWRPIGDVMVNGYAGPVESWYLGFDWRGLAWRSVGEELDLAWSGRSMRVPRVKPIAAAMVPRAVELYAGVRGALARQGLADEVLARALLLELVALFLDLPAGFGREPASRALLRFHELLVERACADDSIERLAAAAGATADHLREQFRARYGARPVEYRTRLRLARARALLVSTTMRVREVARAVGFPDPLYFSRVFRRSYGISPRETILRFAMAPREG